MEHEGRQVQHNPSTSTLLSNEQGTTVLTTPEQHRMVFMLFSNGLMEHRLIFQENSVCWGYFVVYRANRHNLHFTLQGSSLYTARLKNVSMFLIAKAVDACSTTGKKEQAFHCTACHIDLSGILCFTNIRAELVLQSNAISLRNIHNLNAGEHLIS